MYYLYLIPTLCINRQPCGFCQIGSRAVWRSAKHACSHISTIHQQKQGIGQHHWLARACFLSQPIEPGTDGQLVVNSYLMSRITAKDVKTPSLVLITS